MPITQTVNGLKYEWPLDKLSEGGGHTNHALVWSADSTDKQEGSASIKGSGIAVQPGYPAVSYFAVTPPAEDALPGHRIRVWHKSTDANHSWELRVQCIGKTPCPQGSIPYFTTTVISKSGTEAWTLKKADLPSNMSEGANNNIYPSVLLSGGPYGAPINDWIDHLVISTTRSLTITGLTQGQKLEAYRANDNVKIVEATCAAGQSQVIVDIDDQDYPLYVYLKVYATDGITLIEVTSSHRICGGDSWYWVSPYGTLKIESTAFIFIRSSGTGSPKQANITATLLTPAGVPAPNKTIYFTTSRGAVDPTSDITDANGEAHTVLTSTTHGVAVVKASWLGDADIPPAVGFATHHVFYNEESGDVNKKFQFYIEGLEYAYSSGSYKVSNVTAPQEFSVIIPEWLSTITRRGLVSIYRKGVREYGGVLTGINRVMGEASQFGLSGADSKMLLDDRVVTLKDYLAKTLLYILNDLLDTYPCGVALGTVGDYPEALTITFADESLVSTISRLCDLIGWPYRLNADNSLDVKAAFGYSKPSIVFEEGVSLFMTENAEDYGQLSNSVRMRGQETLVSTQFDAASIEAIGLIEAVAFQKSISNQGMLDIAAVAELARRVGGAIKIGADVKDDYDVGEWGIDDWITVTCTETELSGTYKVISITRDMTDPQYGKVEFKNKAAVELSDILDDLKRELKDLSAKTTI